MWPILFHVHNFCPSRINPRRLNGIFLNIFRKVKDLPALAPPLLRRLALAVK
jgi:hypothetical protein